MFRIRSAALFLFTSFIILGRGLGADVASTDGAATATTLAARISGGHDTDPRDHGRPVVLVAAGLGVPTEVFREAFSHVTPAAAGQEPDPQQVQLNKRALLDALGKYGVTNDRLDQVSDTYRYPPGDPNLWKHSEAVVIATVVNGKVTGFHIVKAGGGYTTPPRITVPGFADLPIEVTLHFGSDLQTNGSIAAIKLTDTPTTKP